MRAFCLLCILKHLAQADVLMDEALLGYPLHKWRAVGHLAEAESECLDFSPPLAKRIREYRLSYIDGNDINIDGLLEEVSCKYDGMEK